jgi:hypothetical protein
MVLGFAVIIAIIVSAVLIVGIYTAYLSLLGNGMEFHVAATIIAIAVTLLIAALIALSAVGLYRLRQVPVTIKASTLSHSVSGIVNAFVEGFMCDKNMCDKNKK